MHEYFRLDDSLERIYSRIMKDDHITEAIQRFYGLRLINQDVWECLVSFVIATNTNIPRIKLMISNLCERFGEKASFEGNQYAALPDRAGHRRGLCRRPDRVAASDTARASLGRSRRR